MKGSGKSNKDKSHLEKFAINENKKRASNSIYRLLADCSAPLPTVTVILKKAHQKPFAAVETSLRNLEKRKQLLGIDGAPQILVQREQPNFT